MNGQTDSQLLRAYAEHRSEPAFAELVRRHVDFVYSAALRLVCDSALAEDVTQSVFLALAKNAAQLTARPVLCGWLHRTAQNIAAQTVRSAVRRRAREQEAAAMSALHEPDAVWEQIAPHLDNALSELSETDRDALLLRYFQRKSAREMAQFLGLSEEAVQKRVSRAVERLREFFAKRGITVGANGVIVFISANAVQAAPVGLAVTISAAAAIVGTTAATTATVTATKAIAMTTLQKTLIAATLAAAVGTGVYQARQAARLRSQNLLLQQQSAPLTEHIQQLARERDDATSKLAALRDENERLNRNTVELLKLRGEVARLKSNAAVATAEDDPNQSAVKLLLDRVNKLKQKLEETPNAKIPELQFLTDEDWVDTVRGNLESEADLRKAFSNLRRHGERRFLETMHMALVEYSKANNQQFPAELSQLKPFFETTPGDDILQRYQIVPADSMPHANFGGNGDWFITPKTPIDEENDTLWTLGRSGLGGATYQFAKAFETLAPAVRALTAATPTNINGRRSIDLSQLLPYLTTPEQKAAYEKLTRVRTPDSK